MRSGLARSLILLVLMVAAMGGALVTGGCAAASVPEKEVSQMKALEIPQIDLEQPATVETATFALG
jgi:hypothetical protein